MGTSTSGDAPVPAGTSDPGRAPDREAAAAAKDAWRRWAAARRAALGPVDHAAVVAGLLAFLAAPPVAGRGWVLTYRPMPGEPDLDALLADPDLGPRCAVTRTVGRAPLTLHPAAAPTERHRFGFLQPVADAPRLDPAEVAVALVPGVLFDRRGTRLGHGAGHYDRLLPLLAPGTPLVGVARTALVVAVELPREAHDWAMTHLATEDGVRPVES